MPEYLIAHDLGTSGNKATLFSTDGRLVRAETYAYATRYPGGGRAEQDPRDWWDAVRLTTRRLLAGIDKRDVLAVSFSGQMMGCLCVDKYGLPLRDCLIWADTRSIAEEDYLKERLGARRIYEITGQLANAGGQLEKLMWLRKNEPEVYKNTYKTLTAKDYIVFRMTGQFLTDHTDASETSAFDLNAFKWSEEMVEAAGIEMSMLPDARPSIHVVCEGGKGAAEECGLSEKTLVVLGGGDGACASVGAGSVVEGRTYNCLGSSSWVATTSKKLVLDPEMRTFNYGHLMPGYVCPCGTMQAAGASYEWMKNALCGEEALLEGNVYDRINREIGASPAGSNGLYYLPYLLGERSPRWNPRARGAFVGLTMEHTHADMLRSVVEGVGFNLRIILDVLRGYYEISSISVLGGLAKSEAVCRILADIYGTEIVPLSHPDEATSIGAAVCAGVGIGIYKDFSAVESFISAAASYAPDTRSHALYDNMLPIFDRAYEALVPIFEEL